MSTVAIVGCGPACEATWTIRIDFTRRAGSQRCAHRGVHVGEKHRIARFMDEAGE